MSEVVWAYREFYNLSKIKKLYTNSKGRDMPKMVF